ncbi:adenosylcobinamide-GDP ribazoletransferase [Nocardia higoensis]|uniref:adenosylcobinamide-GDP ribazoletransferase n=1 Tax=Nocardia higoensis TaxID=228599 RepID=UPI0002E882CE|nr:adenosylcobinamide-GDP ribazoletransferase [Nocardia higoensis]
MTTPRRVSWPSGARLAFSWLSVLPVRGPDEVDRRGAARAIALAPLVGAALGALAAALAWSSAHLGASAPLAALLAVGGLALATRGMHLDGLADTADGLGSYGPPERARAIMKGGDVGPFGVAAIVFAIAVQSFAFAALIDEDRWLALALAVGLGRVAVVLACHGAPPAAGTGFGALVAGTQSRLSGAAWALVAMVCAIFAVPDHPWLGPVAALAALAAALLLVRHCVRRFEGLSGDVLGAAIEVTVAVAAVGFSLATP